MDWPSLQSANSGGQDEDGEKRHGKADHVGGGQKEQRSASHYQERNNHGALVADFFDYFGSGYREDKVSQKPGCGGQHGRPVAELEDVFKFLTSTLFKLVKKPNIPNRMATVIKGPT